jgi:hypothetical protein
MPAFAPTAQNSKNISRAKRYISSCIAEEEMRKFVKAFGSMMMTAGLFSGVVTIMAANV